MKKSTCSVEKLSLEERFLIVEDDHLKGAYNGKFYNFPIDEVCYVLSAGDRSLCFLKSGEKVLAGHKTSLLMKEFANHYFANYNKGGFVNLIHVSIILPLEKGNKHHKLLLKNGVELEISISRYKPLKKIVNAFC